MLTLHRVIKKHRDSEEGFTLIELLVVVLILAILTAVVLFGIGAFQDQGQLEACKTDYKSLKTAEAAYYADQTPFAYGTEAQLQSGGYIEEVSTLYDADAAGAVTIQDPGDCVGVTGAPTD
jgi:general secretion pathway protein G